MYTYAARCVRVVDGDTIDAVVDLGFHLSATLRFRFYGIDTPELTSKDALTRTLALEAKAHVTACLPPVTDGFPLRIESKRDPDSFGRWLANVWYTPPSGALTLINAELIARGLAKPYRR
jgi:micrococcal nuclease